MQVKYALVVRKDEADDRLPHEGAPRYAEQVGRREVGLLDQPVVVQRAIAHRCQIVELEIARPRCIDLLLGAPQLVVLHLQLDLMHAQLVEQLVRGFRRKVLGIFRVRGILRPRNCLGLAFQIVRVVVVFSLLCHWRTCPAPSILRFQDRPTICTGTTFLAIEQRRSE